MADLCARRRVHLGRVRDPRRDRVRQGATEVPGRLVALAVAGLAVIAQTAAAQSAPPNPDAARWLIAGTAGALRIDDKLSPAVSDEWVVLGGVRGGVRVGRQVTFGGVFWWSGADPSVRGGGLEFSLEPLGARPRPVQPILHFGVESVRVDDDTDRSPALVFGGGLRRIAGSFLVDLSVRNRFLTADLEEEDGIDRDVSLWEIGVTIGALSGGDGR